VKRGTRQRRLGILRIIDSQPRSPEQAGKKVSSRFFSELFKNVLSGRCGWTDTSNHTNRQTWGSRRCLLASSAILPSLRMGCGWDTGFKPGPRKWFLAPASNEGARSPARGGPKGPSRGRGRTGPRQEPSPVLPPDSALTLGPTTSSGASGAGLRRRVSQASSGGGKPERTAQCPASCREDWDARNRGCSR